MTISFGVAVLIAVLLAMWAKSSGVKRSRDNTIAGVCGGLAKHFGVDVTGVRIAAVILAMLGGLFFWAYIVAWFILEEE